jgi:glycosyltransferase involved in cell wall biosynthesis
MSTHLKVCHIISGDLWAGAEVMAYHLLKGLREFPEIELSAIILNQGKLADEIKRLAIPCHIIDECKLSFPRILLKSRKILKQSPVHILHSHRYKENFLACLVSKTIRGMRLVSTQHGMPEDCGVRAPVFNRMQMKLNHRALSHSFHSVVAVSGEMKASLVRDCGFEENQLTVIHNGVALTQAGVPGKKSDMVVIGSAGRFFPVKGYPLMVEIAREISRKSAIARFVLAGEGPGLQHLQQLIQQYELEKIFRLPGFVHDMDTFYRGSDIYLNTSFHEGIPMSILEAMAHGVPVIAPKVGGLREIITDGVDGFLVDGRNPRDFAERCLMLVADSKRRISMGEQAREKVENSFSVQYMAKNYYCLYKDLTI